MPTPSGDGHRKPAWQTRKWLRGQFADPLATCQTVAGVAGVHFATIAKWCRRHRIPPAGARRRRARERQRHHVSEG